MSNLGRLEKVDLRKVWEHEQRDFSDWLSREENLALLSEELGIGIEAVGTEQNFGRFRIDILAKETNSGDYIIIENQLETTNHDHLGKVITYAAGFDAKYVIWIVKDVLDEHQRAIEWLNENLDESISCFLVKIEVWRIGDSRPAPRFEIISLRNNWVANLKRTTVSGDISENKVRQHEFWTALTDNFRTRDPKMALQSPAPKHWHNFSLGSSFCHPNLTINSKENFVSCDLWTNNKEFLVFLQEREERIKQELEVEFEWWEANKTGGIRATLHVDDVYDQRHYPSSFDWLYRNVKTFQEVFSKYVREFKAL
jgi:hypothetical protein